MMFATLTVLLAAVAQPRVVLSGLGELAGVTEVTPAGVSVDKFLGVPYAQPPVGDLRFRAPQAPEAWSGVRDATEYGNTCLGSRCAFVGGVDGESCLFANVFRPTGVAKCDGKPGRFGPNCNENLPVMVYFHGGSFDNGCSNEFKAENWVAASVANGRPVVAVTFNYRLGVLGYLGSDALRGGDASKSTGNYGTLDQRQLLVWLQQHVSRFGGDPRKVTLVGESAGGAGITVHLVSEESYGRPSAMRFRRVIAQSGLAPLVFGYRTAAQADQVFGLVAGATGCAAAADVAQCLRQLPEQAMRAVVAQVPRRVFAPLIDGVVLTDAPWRLLRDGKFARHVSVVEGTQRDEFAQFLLGDASELSGSATEADFDARLQREIGTGPQAQFLLQQVKRVYSNETHDYPPVSEWGGRSYWWWAFLRIVTDRVFVCPSRYAARAIARGPHGIVGEARAAVIGAAVYSYFFTRVTRTRTPITGTGPDAFTAGHATIIPYTFNCSAPSACVEERPIGECETVDRAPCAFDNADEQRLADYYARTLASFAAKFKVVPKMFTRLNPDAPQAHSVVQIDGAPEDSGVSPLLGHRAVECGFWDTIDRPENTASTAADEYTTMVLKSYGM